MKRIIFSVMVLCAVMLAGCLTDAQEPTSGEVVEINGTVVYMTIEGGFWAITAISDEQNITYEPLNLPEEFRKEGLSVFVEATVRKDMASFRMVGPIIEIRSIRER
ncbi:MAG TPA: hypothetical protein VGB10_01425 [Bacteroidota bacterium]